MNTSIYVWAKMKGYSAWPAKKCQTPPEDIKKPKNTAGYACVYFYGTYN